jgi:hypothetical protein
MSKRFESPVRSLCALRLTRLLLAAALVAVWSSASRAQSESSSGEAPLHLFSPLRTDPEPIHVRLSGRDYDIPANYFDAVLQPGLDQRDILLVALLPSLEARTRENWDEFMKVPGWGRRVTLLIKVLKRPDGALAAQLRAAQYISGPFEVIGIEHGLEHSIPAGEGRFRKRQEVFVARDGEQFIAVIECTRDGDYPQPGCEHHFLVSGLFVKALYDKRYLPEWRSIQDSVISLMKGFQKP